MAEILFHKQGTGALLGTVRVDSSTLTATTPSTFSIVDAWDGSPKEFLNKYRKWANGYVYTIVLSG